MAPNIDELNNLKGLIPAFADFDEKAVDNQKRWRSRFLVSLAILGIIAFFDAFVTAPDHFLFGYGKEVRIVSLISSVLGVFITLRLHVSDKTRYRNWTENRAKVEQIRSEVWYFLFDLWSENNKQGPYTMGEFKAYINHLDVSGKSEINQKLLEQLKERVAGMASTQKVQRYRDLRLDKQILYFDNRSSDLAKRRRRCKRLTLTFLLFSVGWGVMKMIGEFYQVPQLFTDISPLGMMISFIALVSTYVEGNNMDEVEFKYSQMSKGLESLNKDGDGVTTHENFNSWVKACEMFLRAQNNEWSLRRY
jgi:hypothetical protein